MNCFYCNKEILYEDYDNGHCYFDDTVYYHLQCRTSLHTEFAKIFGEAVIWEVPERFQVRLLKMLERKEDWCCFVLNDKVLNKFKDIKYHDMIEERRPLDIR